MTWDRDCERDMWAASDEAVMWDLCNLVPRVSHLTEPWTVRRETLGTRLRLHATCSSWLSILSIPTPDHLPVLHSSSIIFKLKRGGLMNFTLRKIVVHREYKTCCMMKGTTEDLAWWGFFRLQGVIITLTCVVPVGYFLQLMVSSCFIHCRVWVTPKSLSCVKLWMH